MRNMTIAALLLGLASLGACDTDRIIKEPVDTGEGCADDSGDMIDTGSDTGS